MILRQTASLAPALERGLNILELLATKTEGFTFKEILTNFNIPRPSLFRLLKELQKRRYVRQEPNTKRYQLGFKILNLSTTILAGLDLRTQARPFLQKLMKVTGETVELVLLHESELLHIDKFETSQSIRIFAQIGSRYPTLHASAHGKVFLAYMREEDREKIVKRGLKKITENTITNKQKFRKKMEEICKKGYAFDFGEVRIDVSRCSAPIYGHSGEVIASIGIAGPAFRMGIDKKEEFGRKVKHIALEISKVMGWDTLHQRSKI